MADESTSDETTDAAALCSTPVRQTIHLVRHDLLSAHDERTLLDALDAVPCAEDRDHAVARAEQAEREREGQKARADAWMRACAALPCHQDPDNPCDEEWALLELTDEEICNSCWARVCLPNEQERT